MLCMNFTGDINWRASTPANSSVRGSALRWWRRSGRRASTKRTSASARESLGRAGHERGVESTRDRERQHPLRALRRASSPAARTASTAPETTSCPGEL